jgi:hypothetical protein
LEAATRNRYADAKLSEILPCGRVAPFVQDDKRSLAFTRFAQNIWIPVAEEAVVVQEMAGRGWAIRAGECYRLKSATGIRVTVSTMTREESRRFAADLAAAIRPRSSAQSA